LNILKANFSPSGQGDKSLTWMSPEPDRRSDKIVSFNLSLSGEKCPLGNLEIIWAASDGLFPPGMSRVLNVMANEFCRGLD
jgi:hypothetical protein